MKWHTSTTNDMYPCCSESNDCVCHMHVILKAGHQRPPAARIQWHVLMQRTLKQECMADKDVHARRDCTMTQTCTGMIPAAAVLLAF